MMLSPWLDDVGDQLCERVLGVLYEIWLIACVKSFPSPTLWKTFREMCMNWRHRTGQCGQFRCPYTRGHFVEGDNSFLDISFVRYEDA